VSTLIPITVTYLEQTTRPNLPRVPCPHGKSAILRARHMPIHFYRYLYHQVGNVYNWISRTELSDSQLAQIIHHDNVFIYVLYIEGAPAGFAEIDGRHPSIPEIKFFGLLPEFIGKGFGRYFLTHIIDLAWQSSKEYPPSSNPVTGQAHSSVSSQSQNFNVTTTHNDPPSIKSTAKRLRIETCTLDHPAALPLYQKFGFTVFDQRKGQVPTLPGFEPRSNQI